MDVQLAIVVALIAVALAFDFINGFHDAANSIATVVSTRVLSPGKAVVWAAFFNFAAAFLVRYQETDDPLEASAFAACAASCAVEGVGATTLGDRAEVERRMQLRDSMIETGEWQE